LEFSSCLSNWFLASSLFSEEGELDDPDPDLGDPPVEEDLVGCTETEEVLVIVLEGGVDNNEDKVDILGIADDIMTTGNCWWWILCPPEGAVSAVRRYDVVEVTEATGATFDKFELVEFEEAEAVAEAVLPVRWRFELGTSPTMECIETIELEFEFNALWYFDLVWTWTTLLNLWCMLPLWLPISPVIRYTRLTFCLSRTAPKKWLRTTSRSSGWQKSRKHLPTMDKVLAATEALKRLEVVPPDGEVSVCITFITLKEVGSNFVVNSSVAFAIMALLAAACCITALEVTTVKGWGLTSLSLRATHKSLEVSALSWSLLTVIQATYNVM
jgi:hypothetical protein